MTTTTPTQQPNTTAAPVQPTQAVTYDTPEITGRDARITVYLEPKLAAVVQHVAGGSASSWIRDIVFEKLLTAGKLPQDLIVEMARRK